jgi:3',5'-cyclic AMP phosphodiesterase CpdA
MLRLAHLSDIHITASSLEWKRQDWFNKRYTSWFNYRWLGRRNRFLQADQVMTALMKDVHERQVDHVIFSGDATALGFESEFSRAAEFLEVSKRPGLAIPGNHDYCTPFAAFSGLFERHFAPWQIGQRLDEAIYPFAQRVGPAWLLGVNSSTGNVWPWDAGGKVGADQLDRLRRLLAQLEPGPRILITHFPLCLANGQPERRGHGLRDVGQLVQIAEWGGVQLWLHGHRHEPYIILKPPMATFPVICAGSATQTNLWSYFEYLLTSEQIQVKRRFFDALGNRFQEGENVTIPLAMVSPEIPS